MDFKNCIILFGGSSEERLVSVASAQNLCTHLAGADLYFWSKTGEVFAVTQEELLQHTNPFTEEFITKAAPLSSSLSEIVPLWKDRIIIIALHGTEGEDGTLQKLLESYQVKFTGSGSKASTLAFDKVLTKKLAKEIGLTTAPDFDIPTHFSDWAKLEAFFNQHKKIVLKPVANGSSVGLFIVDNINSLLEAITKIKNSQLHYLAESFITGREITVGVRERLNHNLEALPCSEVKVNQGRQFDYEGKYLGSGVQELTPAPISETEKNMCQEIALKIHAATKCQGYSRTDLILTTNGTYFLEINTLPGLSKASFIPQQLHAINVSLKDFLGEQVQLAHQK